jgi:hypothetical protein
MNFFRLFPVYISLILLSAHFLYHTGQRSIAVIPLIFLIPLLFRNGWVPRLIQLVLLLGTVEWLRTLFVEVQHRSANGESWVRYAIILGTVALFTALSSLVFRSKGLKNRYSAVETPGQE